MRTARIVGWLLVLSGVLFADTAVTCNNVTAKTSCLDTGPLGDFAKASVNDYATVDGNGLTFITEELAEIKMALVGDSLTHDTARLSFTETYTINTPANIAFLTTDGGKRFNQYDNGITLAINGTKLRDCTNCAPIQIALLPITLGSTTQLTFSGSLSVDTVLNSQNSPSYGTGKLTVSFLDSNLNPVNITQTPEPKNLVLAGLIIAGFVCRRRVLPGLVRL